jgi:hypothetical protein
MIVLNSAPLKREKHIKGVEMKKTMKFQSKKGELSFSASEEIPAFEKNTKNVKVNINQTFPTFGKILDHTFQRNKIF